MVPTERLRNTYGTDGIIKHTHFRAVHASGVNDESFPFSLNTYYFILLICAKCSSSMDATIESIKFFCRASVSGHIKRTDVATQLLSP